MILDCQWHASKNVKCSSLFKVIRTDNGFCCSFNAILQSDQLWVL